jgi:pyruvate/2-oxoglutarate dehydrogenase complex dihydrolipoamide acyltransferase (E2) component
VSLASTHDRLAVAPDGTLVVELVRHLGLAYDHRFCTDRDAIAVPSSLKAAIEAPERLAGR